MADNPIEKIRDGLYIKKSFGSYSVVYPIKKDLEQPWSLKNTNWKNFLLGGSWLYALKILIVMGIVIFFIWGYKHDTQACREFNNDIYNKCYQVIYGYYPNITLNNNTSGIFLNNSLYLPSPSNGH
jgi:hypothetical protein